MTCEDCTTASQEPHHGFKAGCPGCCARAISRGLNYFESLKQGQQTRRYRAELQQFGMTHQQVKDAAQADVMRREVSK